jgi:hypothetical protein
VCKFLLNAANRCQLPGFPAVQAGIGLAIGMGIAYAIPALRRRMALANGICGAALLVACGVILMVG